MDSWVRQDDGTQRVTGDYFPLGATALCGEGAALSPSTLDSRLRRPLAQPSFPHATRRRHPATLPLRGRRASDRQRPCATRLLPVQHMRSILTGISRR